MKMIELMGMTVVQAASEAEAQCALLCREGKVIYNHYYIIYLLL